MDCLKDSQSGTMTFPSTILIFILAYTCQSLQFSGDGQVVRMSVQSGGKGSGDGQVLDKPGGDAGDGGNVIRLSAQTGSEVGKQYPVGYFSQVYGKGKNFRQEMKQKTSKEREKIEKYKRKLKRIRLFKQRKMREAPKQKKGSYVTKKQRSVPHISSKQGTNGAASNDGSLIKWENVQEIFTRKRRKRQAVECCKKLLVSSTGEANRQQWDRLGLYYTTGQIMHGRMVYQHENKTQNIFYSLGEFDGWLLGPKPGVNYGGIKNYHDGMCVHTSDIAVSRKWGYYDGPTNTKNPEEAFPYWNYSDETLSVRCVSKVVNIDSKKIPDKSRGPMLRKLYRKARPLLREKCGSPIISGKLNMDAWIVMARCGGDCHKNNITLQLTNGKADILIVVAQSEIDLTRYCFRCHSYWSGRLLSGQKSNWSTVGPGMAFRLYVIIVGYDDYVSLSVNIDSNNLVDVSAHKLK